MSAVDLLDIGAWVVVAAVSLLALAVPLMIWTDYRGHERTSEAFGMVAGLSLGAAIVGYLLVGIAIFAPLFL